MQVDLFGPWTIKTKNKKTAKIHIISMIDVCTRWLELYPITGKHPSTLATSLTRNGYAVTLNPER
eukprot:4350151-Ditylum_brightwellii.AAC.1